MTALIVASFFFATTAILIRYASDASPLSLTFLRLSIAAIAMILFASARRSLRLLGRRDLMLVVISGVFLSVHFAAFIYAVKQTTIANATFLDNTSPVMLAILSPIIIRERTTRREAAGVLIATLGVVFIANAGNGFHAFGLGDISALLAAFFVSLYSLVGRYLRTSGVSTACYTAYVYSVAALVALLMISFFGADKVQSYNTQTIIAAIGVALLPTAVGHSLYNYSLGSVKAVTANLFPLLEPIVASIFAIPLFGEVPNTVEVIGYALILLAVTIVATNLTNHPAQV